MSVAIYRRIDAYRRILESYSAALLPVIEWQPTPDGNVEVLKDTADFHRYFDATAHAEFLYACVEQVIAQDTLDKIRWLLGIAYPMIGTLPVSKISPQEVLAVLRKVEATGRYESAQRMRSILSRVVRYSIATARADRDVAAGLRGALITPKVQHLAAITTPKEAGALLRAIDDYTGHEITAIALRLSSQAAPSS